MLNHELAITILSNLYNKVQQEGLQSNPLFLQIVYEYAELLLLNFQQDEAYEFISKAVNKIPSDLLQTTKQKFILAKLILLKTIILTQMGYLQDAEKLFGKLDPFFSSENKFFYRIEKLRHLLKQADYAVFNSEMRNIQEDIERSEFLGNKQLAQQKLSIVKLEYYYETKQFVFFEETLDFLSDLFSQYDQLMLVRSMEFLEFIKFKILA